METVGGIHNEAMLKLDSARAVPEMVKDIEALTGERMQRWIPRRLSWRKI
jgi:hypothetical protein